VSSVYVYGLADPRDGKIRYVGQTRNLASRLACHLSSACIDNWRPSKKDQWIQELARLELRPTIVALETCQDSHSEEAEMRWFEKLSMDCELLNTVLPRGGKKRNPPSAKRTKVACLMDRDDKDRCSSAAAVEGKGLDEWARETLIAKANETLPARLRDRTNPNNQRRRCRCNTVVVRG
jgi:hypothetical protein